MNKYPNLLFKTLKGILSTNQSGYINNYTSIINEKTKSNINPPFLVKPSMIRYVVY